METKDKESIMSYQRPAQFPQALQTQQQQGKHSILEYNYRQEGENTRFTPNLRNQYNNLHSVFTMDKIANGFKNTVSM